MFIYVVKLLMMLNIFIFILIQSFAIAQIEDLNLSIDSRNIKKNTNQYLDNLKNDIEFYILSTNFLNTNNEHIKIFLDINLIIESISDNNVISAHVLFSNRSDQILFSDGIDFEYELGQNLIYSTSYNSLTSFLDYNIFIMIAGELDKHSYKGGENYYIRSEDIAFKATMSDYPRRWNKRLKQSQELKNNLYLRNIKHTYQNISNYLNNDEDEFDDDIIINYLEEFYSDLINIDDNYGEHKNTLHFLNSKLINIVELYYEYDMIYVIKFLKKYDENNTDFYIDYID